MWPYAHGPGESMNSVTLFACAGETKTFAWSARVLVPNFHDEYEYFCESCCLLTEPGMVYWPGPGTGAPLRFIDANAYRCDAPKECDGAEWKRPSTAFGA